MEPAEVFGLANLFVLIGWAMLVLAVVLKRPRVRDIVVGTVWPTLLSVLYVAALAVGLPTTEGSFSSLADVRALFASDWVLLAGWVHYLAFDLFVGARIAADSERAGLSRLLLVPVLPLTFLFGPAGFFLFVVLRHGFAGAASMRSEA